MLEVSGCLGNGKETSVGENWKDVWFNQVYMVSERKKWKVSACQQVIKKYKCLQKKKEKCIDTDMLSYAHKFFFYFLLLNHKYICN